MSVKVNSKEAAVVKGETSTRFCEYLREKLASPLLSFDCDCAQDDIRLALRLCGTTFRVFCTFCEQPLRLCVFAV